jgi:hypothetical protein
VGHLMLISIVGDFSHYEEEGIFEGSLVMVFVILWRLG